MTIFKFTHYPPSLILNCEKPSTPDALMDYYLRVGWDMPELQEEKPLSVPRFSMGEVDSIADEMFVFEHSYAKMTREVVLIPKEVPTPKEEKTTMRESKVIHVMRAFSKSTSGYIVPNISKHVFLVKWPSI